MVDNTSSKPKLADLFGGCARCREYFGIIGALRNSLRDAGCQCNIGDGEYESGTAENCPLHRIKPVETTDRTAKLEFALRGLYWDQVDYLMLNKLGGMQNHWMRAAREALGMDPDDIRPAVEPSPKPDCPKSSDGWHYWQGQGTAYGACVACGLAHSSNERIAREHNIKDWYRGPTPEKASEAPAHSLVAMFCGCLCSWCVKERAKLAENGSVPQQPPVDNDHVAPGCEKFDE